MALNHTQIVRAFVRGAVAVAEELKLGGKADATPAGVLLDVLKGHFKSAVTNGATLVSSSANGTAVSFSVPENLDPGTVMAIAEEALTWIENQPDPLTPTSPRRIMRLRPDFSASWPNL